MSAAEAVPFAEFVSRSLYGPDGFNTWEGRAGRGEVTIDYCSATTSGLALRPWRDWLRTYRQHGRGDRYLAGAGGQDITAEVAIDQLPEPDTVRTQSQWLQLQGTDELAEEGRRYWGDHAAAPDLVAMQMRSRVSEAEALVDPTGLGGFLVGEWRTPVGEVALAG